MYMESLLGAFHLLPRSSSEVCAIACILCVLSSHCGQAKGLYPTYLVLAVTFQVHTLIADVWSYTLRFQAHHLTTFLSTLRLTSVVSARRVYLGFELNSRGVHDF
jgi:hypothetical protein